MARSTLRHRLYALVFLWVVVLSVVAIVATQSSLARLREAAVEERMLLGLSVAHSLDWQIAHVFADLRLLVSDLEPPFDRHLDRIRALRFGIPFRRAIYVLDEDGSPMIADPRATTPISAEWLDGRESVTPSVRKTPEAEPVAAIIQPFELAGRTHYVVAEMALNRFTASALLSDLASHRDLRLLVVDEGGEVLAAHDPSAVAWQLPPEEKRRLRAVALRPAVITDAPCYLCAEASTADFVTIVVPLDLAPWRLVVQEEAARVFGGVYWWRLHLFGALSMVALTGFALSWSLSRSVADPLGRLSRQAERLREGDLSSSIGVKADREITLLAETLDDARCRLAASLEDLRAVNETLELQVDERTREIRELLEEALSQDAKRRSLVRRLLSAGEEERRRIARELHDEISQLLTVVVLALERIPGEDVRVTQAKDLLARTQREIKRIIADLRPSLLDDLGLSMAVRGHAKDFLVSRGIAVHLEIDEVAELPEEIETTAFRIYQEIATNIARHSGAEHVAVEIYLDGATLVLSIEDDGVGFVPERDAGTGIVGMHERADLVGGTVTIESAPGTGTHVRFECPVGAQPRGLGRQVGVVGKAADA